MGKIYKGQTKLEIILDTGNDLTDASLAKIKYEKPSGVEGEWTASIITPINGEVSYVPTSTGTLNEAGTWKLWSFVTWKDGRVAAGEPTYMQIYNEGE